MGDFFWSREPFAQSGIIALRSGDQSTKESRKRGAEFYKRFLDKAWDSAERGVVSVLFAERPQQARKGATDAEVTLSSECPGAAVESGVVVC